jgi:hypothetical protein
LTESAESESIEAENVKVETIEAASIITESREFAAVDVASTIIEDETAIEEVVLEEVVSETEVSRFKKEPVQLKMPVAQPAVQTKLPLQIQPKVQVQKQFSFKKPEQKLSVVTAKALSEHIYSVENNQYVLAYKIGTSSDNVRFLVSSDLDKLKVIETIIQQSSQASLLKRVASLKLIGQQFGFTKMNQINFATKYVGIKLSTITISAKI